MPKEVPKSTRKLYVASNYLSLFSLSVICSIGEYTSWNGLLAVLGILASLSTVLTFHFVFTRTGLLQLTHQSYEKLDEREVQVTHSAYRKSYTFFSGLSLLIITFITLSVRFSFFTLTHRGHYSFGLIVLFGLNYLVHTLPAAIVAWNEKEVLAR